MPSAFAPTDEAVRELLLRHRAADLVTAGLDGLAATMLPFLYAAQRHTLRGLRMTYAPKVLRHFTARFEEIPAPVERPMAIAV